MEIHTQALDDQLIPGLTLKMSPGGSSHVTERRNTTQDMNLVLLGLR